MSSALDESGNLFPMVDFGCVGGGREHRIEEVVMLDMELWGYCGRL